MQPVIVWWALFAGDVTLEPVTQLIAELAIGLSRRGAAGEQRGRIL
jgi:hypothetical protein